MNPPSRMGACDLPFFEAVIQNAVLLKSSSRTQCFEVVIQNAVL
jgi:hypothetical protein